MVVELGLDRSIVDDGQHGAQGVDVLAAEQIGKGGSLFRGEIERLHSVLSSALHSARVGPRWLAPPAGGGNRSYTLFRALP